MKQFYQPDFSKVMQGEGHRINDEETLAAIRKVLAYEHTVAPAVVRAPFDGKSRPANLRPAQFTERADRASLAARLLDKLRT